MNMKWSMMSIVLVASLFFARSAQGQSGSTVMWQQQTPQGANLLPAVNPATGEAVLVGVEGLNLVSRQLKTGQLLWSQPLNFTYESQPVKPYTYLQGAGSEAVALYLYAELPDVGGFLVFSYWSTYSIANGTELASCNQNSPATGPAFDPSSSAIYNSRWTGSGLQVNRYDGLRDVCLPTARASFASTTGNIFGSGLTPVLIANNGDFASITTQFSSNPALVPLNLQITRFDPATLSTVWQAYAPNVTGCQMGEQEPLLPNILVASTPSSAAPDVYSCFLCQNTDNSNVIFKVNGQGQVVGYSQYQSLAGTPASRSVSPAFFALIEPSAAQQAPCFLFSADGSQTKRCFAPTDDLSPLYDQLPATVGAFSWFTASGGYLWYYNQQAGLQGYTLAGLFAAPPQPAFVSAAVAQLPVLYSLQWLSASPPQAFVTFDGGIALLELSTLQTNSK